MTRKSDDKRKADARSKDTVQSKPPKIVPKKNPGKNKKDGSKAAEERFRLFSEAAEEGLAIHDQGTIVDVNPACARMFGYELSEMIGMEAEKLATPESWKTIKEHIAGGYDKSYESVGRRKDGSTFPCAFIGKPCQYQGRTLRVATFSDITERKRMENSLRTHEEKFELAFKYSPIGICISALCDGRYVEVNDVYSNFLGYSREELIGRTSSDINLWFNTEERDALIRELFQKGTVTGFELRFRDKTGEIHWGYVSAAIVTIRGESYLLTQTQDITEQKKMKQELEKSETMYRLLADHTKDQIWLMDLDLNITYISPSVEKVSGYTPEEFMKTPLAVLLTEKSLRIGLELFETEITKASQHLSAPSYSVSAEMEFRHKDGHIFPIEATMSFIQDKNGKPLYILGESKDITERKQAEEKLRREEQMFRSFAEQSTDIIVLSDRKGTVLYENPAMEKILGYKAEERIGTSGFELVHPDDLPLISEHTGKLFNDAKASSVKGEMRLRHKNGSWRTFEVTASNLTHNDTVEAAIINMHDITERKRVEKALRQSEEKYRLLADHMKDYVWLMDLNLNIVYVSPSAEKLMGYTGDDFKTMPIDKILTAASFESAMDFFSAEMPKALAASPDYTLERSLELEFCCRDGHTVWGECNFTFIRDDQGNPLQILGVSRNITERKQMEDALKRSEENFRRSLDESPLGVRISSIEGKTIYANQAILDMYGYDSVEELINTPLKERYTPESFAEYQTRKAKRLKGETGPSEYEISIVRKDGEIRHLHVFRKQTFWNGNKQSQVIYQDVTLRRQAEEKIGQMLENLRQSVKITIQVLGTASEAKDPYMAGHQKRVADLARAIATEMKLPHDKIEAIRMAGAIHDIGKISVPSEILCKPAILSDLEFSFVKNHPRYSYDIIKEVESPWPLADIVHQHHERIDGSGYPLGLKGADILIESRILAVADVVEAMISYRPYRPALGIDIALAEIENNAGILYDRHVAQACIRLFREKGFHMA